jgi:hypothetical protein
VPCRWIDGLLSWVSGLLCALSGLEASDKLKEEKMPLKSRKSSPVASFGVLVMKLRIWRTIGGHPLGNHQSDKSTPHKAPSLVLSVMGYVYLIT